MAARGEAWLGGALAARQGSLALHDDSFVTRGLGGKGAAVGDLDVEAQADFSRGVRVGLGQTSRFHTTLRPIGAQSVRGEEDGGRVLYRDAWNATDAVVVAGARFAEVALVLKDATAPRSFSWTVERPPAIAGVRLRDEGALTLDDAKGEAVMRVRAPIAVDANGGKVSGAIAWRDGTLTVSIDTSNLVFPVVLDPTLDVPVLHLVSANQPGQPYDTRLVYFNNAILKLGGRSTSADVTSAVFQYVPNAAPPTFDHWSYLSDLPIGAVEDHAAAASSKGDSYTVADGYNGSANINTWATYDAVTGWGPASTVASGAIQQATRSGSMMASATVHTSGPFSVALMVLFDGDGSATYDELWHAPSGGSWTPYSYPFGAVRPPKRHDGGLVDTNAISSGLLLIGGATPSPSVAPIGDTWLLSPSFSSVTLSYSFAWTAVCGTGATAACGYPGRKQMALARDSARGRIVMGTGRDDSTGANYGDLWEFDEPTQLWVAMCGTATTPACVSGGTPFSARYGAAMAFDPTRDRTVIVGGYNDASGKFLKETWEYYVRANSCTTSAQCDTGNCVDGVCCESVVCGTCQACNLASSPGVCANVGANVDDPDSCGGGVSSCDGAGKCKSKPGQLCSDVSGATCVSGHCVTGVCCTAASCAAGQICQPTTGACIGDLGFACSSASQCNSGFCVDGVCCDSACDPSKPCQACGASGHCGAIAGPQPSSRVASAAACPSKASGDAACAHSACNGSDISACHYPDSTSSCTGSSICTGGVEYDASGCNGSGDCGYTSAKSCGVFNCVGAACKTVCTVNTDCASGFFCSSGACVGLSGAGAACASSAQCKSGLRCTDGVCCTQSSCAPSGSCNGSHPGTCTFFNGQSAVSGSLCTSGIVADGVCCNGACTGQCEACNVGGSVGTCVPTPNGAQPAAGHAKCTPVSGDATCGVAACNGSNRAACAAPPAGTSCGANACSGGSATTVGKCDGVGGCSGQLSLACAPYACGASACKTTCASDTDCVGGNYCDPTKHCAARLGNGTTCSAGDQCTSGNCVDGVCCSSASCAAGGVCNDPSFLGTCSIKLGKACVAGTPCASGSCADGVCCSTSCTGQCEACDLAGLAGTCSPVPNKAQPHGSRTACAKSGTDPTCSQATCDGVQRKQCAFPDSNSACGTSSCSGGKFTSAGVCSGGGACTPTSSGGCAPYLCGTSSCLTDCSAHGDTDCAPGAYCDTTKHCSYRTAAGTPCATSSACGSGLYCVDFICCGSPACAGGACVNSGVEKGVCKSANAQSCHVDDDCVSNHCADGVCCNSACTEQCVACNNVGAVGVCTNAVGAPVGGRPPCTGDGTTCGTQTCTGGSKTCAAPPASTPCGATACATDTNAELDPGYCDPATNKCALVTRLCGYFRCSAAGCRVTCASDGDCVTNAYCASDGSCQLKGVLGQTCDPSIAGACGVDASGGALGCQDGVCCNDPACDAHGGYCGGGHAGTCLAKNNSTCTVDGDCSSGHCVDPDATGHGVCCDTACKGVCESCRASEGPGTCLPILGAPSAGHGLCPAAAGDACSQPRCDGKVGDRCDGHPGADTVCAPASCVVGKYTSDVRCDGSGACPSSTKTDCDNHRTCSDASHCAAGRCTADADCVDGYACETDSGNCKPKGAHCKDTDPTTSIDVGGAEHGCAPYLCNSDGNCKTSCATSGDCAGGNVCDTSASTCVVAGGGSVAASSGCSVATDGDRARGELAVGALVVALVARARRRRTVHVAR